MTIEDWKDILISKLRTNRYFSVFSETFLRQELESILSARADLLKKLSTTSPHDLSEKQQSRNPVAKTVLKLLKERIGTIYTGYLTSDFPSRYRLLKNLSFPESTRLLRLHKSSHERYESYPEFFSRLLCWHRPDGIVDFGCGLNPCSLPIYEQVANHIPHYLAIDLAEGDAEFLTEYFSKYNLPGTALSADLIRLEIPETVYSPVYDTGFLLKFVDVLEQQERHRSKRLLEKIPQQYLVVSFATSSVGGKQPFLNQDRGWFQKYLREKEWQFTTWHCGDELYFFIKKNQ